MRDLALNADSPAVLQSRLVIPCKSIVAVVEAAADARDIAEQVLEGNVETRVSGAPNREWIGEHRLAHGEAVRWADPATEALAVVAADLRPRG